MRTSLHRPFRIVHVRRTRLQFKISILIRSTVAVAVIPSYYLHAQHRFVNKEFHSCAPRWYTYYTTVIIIWHSYAFWSHMKQHYIRRPFARVTDCRLNNTYAWVFLSLRNRSLLYHVVRCPIDRWWWSAEKYAWAHHVVFVHPNSNEWKRNALIASVSDPGFARRSQGIHENKLDTVYAIKNENLTINLFL